MRKIILCLSLVLGFTITQAQTTVRALFIGNSYTNTNNLPGVIADLAASTGDSLYYDFNTPGGYTFQLHTTNAATLDKIAAGDWDYVVLQEQSQQPSFPIEQVEVLVFPYATELNELILASNPCAETVFFMTWGRKNGDAINCMTWPPVCTYEGMDDLLQERYEMMAEDNDAILSPVGRLWRHIRTYNPAIELYSGDESHPSTAGTYAAACSFYSVLYRKDPTLASFDFGLDPATASYIRGAAKTVVFDSLDTWFVGRYDALADFSATSLSDGHFGLTNLSVNTDSWLWDMGDGTQYTDFEPTHFYTIEGDYTVQLIASQADCLKSDTAEMELVVEVEISIDPNNPGSPSLLSYRQDQALLTVLANEPDLMLHVVDLQGRLCYSHHLTAAGNTSLSLAHLPNGSYAVRIFRSGIEVENQVLRVIH